MSVFLLLAMLLLMPPSAHPQRCGDSLLIYLRDRNGRVIAPADFELAKVSATYTVDNVENLVDAEPEIKELPPRVKSFSVRAVCGMKVAQFRLRYKGEEMAIRVLNVPGDAGHILLEGIGFRSGAYEVNLGGRPIQNAERYEGEGSKAADPANEIAWVIKDHSLRRSDTRLAPTKRRTIEQLVNALAVVFKAKAMGKLDAAPPYLRGLRIVVEGSLDESRKSKRVNTLAEAERWLKAMEDEDGTPFRETRPFVGCSKGLCTYDFDGGISHHHLYLKKIAYGYRNRIPYIKTIFLLDGD